MQLDLMRYLALIEPLDATERARERERARSVRESYAGMDPDKNQCAVTYAYT